MKRTEPLALRGYLVHLTHYDPRSTLTKDTEQPFEVEVAREIVDRLATSGFNALLVGVSDGVRYASHPELKRHYSVPMEQLADLAAYAHHAGLEVIPKLNFSRSEINRHDWWSRAPGQQWHEQFDDETYWKKGFDCIDEVIAACKPERFFHVGMDEDHDRSHAQYVTAIRTLRTGLKKRGLRTVCWSDSALDYPSGQVYVEKSRCAEQTIPHDNVRLLWNYWAVPRTAAKWIRDQGYELWCAPGWQSREQVQSYRDCVKRLGGKGIVMTRWAKCRSENRNMLLGQIAEYGPVFCG